MNFHEKNIQNLKSHRKIWALQSVCSQKLLEIFHGCICIRLVIIFNITKRAAGNLNKANGNMNNEIKKNHL